MASATGELFVSFVSQISANVPNQCVNSGGGTGCPEEIFADGFESGDTTSWSSTIP